MNNRVNYTLVGSVVLALISAMIFFIFWMLKPNEKEVMTPYYIYFTESVSGLNINSDVKFRGISVGDVKQMRINSKNSEEIQILIHIYEDTPIKVDTVATLKSQGITGLSYIDLSKGTQEAALLKPHQDDEIAVIPSDKSLLSRIETSVETISSRLSKTLNQTEKLLDDDNQKEVSDILQRTSSLLSKMEKTLDDRSVDNIHAILDNSAKITQRIDAMMGNIDRLVDKGTALEDSLKESIASVAQSYQSIAATMLSFKEKNEAGDFSVKDSMQKPMQQFNITMQEMEDFMIKMGIFVDRLQRSPSDFIRVEEEIHKGPGE